MEKELSDLMPFFDSDGRLIQIPTLGDFIASYV